MGGPGAPERPAVVRRSRKVVHGRRERLGQLLGPPRCGLCVDRQNSRGQVLGLLRIAARPSALALTQASGIGRKPEGCPRVSCIEPHRLLGTSTSGGHPSTSGYTDDELPVWADGQGYVDPTTGVPLPT
jgi:hypothetical protein